MSCGMTDRRSEPDIVANYKKTMKNLETITLKVEPLLGKSISHVIRDMCELAARIGCTLECRTNGLLLRVKPGETPEQIQAKIL